MSDLQSSRVTAKLPSPHEILVRRIVADHGASRRGFTAALRRRIDPDCVDVDEFQGWRLAPDAYRIDVGDQNVTIWEVEISSRLGAEKLSGYVDLMWLLDSAYWSMRLVSVDQYGLACEVDLVTWSQGAPMPLDVAEQLDFRAAPPIAGLSKVTPMIPPFRIEAP